MVDYGAVAVRAIQTTLTYVVVLSLGAWLSLWPRESPILNPETCKALSKLSILIFAPALLSISLAENLSLSLLKDGAWLLVAWGCIHVAVNYFLAKLMAMVAKPPRWFRMEFTLAMTSTNGLSLPLIMLEPLCNQAPLSTQKFGEDQNISCQDRALGYLFLYTIPWSFYLFGYAYTVLSPPTGKDESDSLPSNEKDANESGSFLVRVLWNINMKAVYAGVFVGLVKQINDLFFPEDAPLLFVASTVRTVATPMVGVISLLVGSTLGRNLLKLVKRFRKTPSQADTSTSTNIVALESVSSALDAAADNSSNTEETQSSSSGGIRNPHEEEHLSLKQKLIFILGKMLLMPVANIAMVYFLLDRAVPSRMSSEDSKLIKLLLVIECAVPSADTIVGFCLKAGRVSASEVLGSLYLFQYVIGVLTLTVVVSLGHAWAYG